MSLIFVVTTGCFGAITGDLAENLHAFISFASARGWEGGRKKKEGEVCF